MQVKQKTPMEKRNVVYEVPCRDCQLTYIGETRRTMEKRMTEHKYAVKTGDPKNGKDSSACIEDTILHQLGSSKSPSHCHRILEQENYGGHRHEEEAIHETWLWLTPFTSIEPTIRHHLNYVHPSTEMVIHTPIYIHTCPWHHLHFHFDPHSHLFFMLPSLWSTLTPFFSCHHPTTI